MLRFTFLFLLLPFVIFAQNGNSPYSQRGLGEPASDTYTPFAGMANVSTAIPSPFHINVNPAFLPHNRYTTFELGLKGEYKKLTTTHNSVSDGNGGLSYIALSFPITQKYVVNLGLKPLTSVSYNYSKLLRIEGDTTFTTYTFSGKGGINSIYLSQGFQITDQISVGLKTAYNFGAVNKYYSSLSRDIQQLLEERTNEQTNYRGFSAAPSIGFRQKLNKDWYMNIGVIYEIAGRWSYTHSIYKEEINPANEALMTSEAVGDDIKGKVSYPSALNVGISIEKLYKWTIGGEFKMQDWKKFNAIDGSNSLEKITSLALGTQYIPNLNAMKGYLNRAVYKLGVYYGQNSYSLNEEKVNDLGATIGFAMPVGRLSFLNLAFSIGKRGDKQTNLLEENYFRFNIGVTLNDRWFVRSKFD